MVTINWEIMAETNRHKKWARTVIVDNDKTKHTSYQVWVYFPGEHREECGHSHRFYRRAEECELIGLKVLRDRGLPDVGRQV
jgi:hypothetical protein